MSNINRRHRNPETVEEAYERLATLSEVEYERSRKPEAERLDVRVSFLDAQVDRFRQRIGNAEDSAQGGELRLEAPVPYDRPVNGARLLNDIIRLLNEYIILPPGAAEAIAVWILFTYVYDAFPHSPRLAILSPVPGCGKTTVLGLLSETCLKPLAASNITAAATFRTIEMARPTLLMDEADTYFNDNDDLRGVLNSGHSRAGAYVIRTVGEDFEPRRFSTWGAAAIAKIGKMPETLESRSIKVQLKRKRPDETVARFNLANPELVERLSIIRSKAQRWANDNLQALRSADPDVPHFLQNRQEDNWRPMLAIADRCGGEWPERIRNAAYHLAMSNDNDDAAASVQLLTDIKLIFERSGQGRMTTQVILSELHEMVNRPWPEWKNSKPITDRQVARILNQYGISSKNIRTGYSQQKGYEIADFEDAFIRYLPAADVPASQPGDRQSRVRVRVRHRNANEQARISHESDVDNAWDAGTDE